MGGWIVKSKHRFSQYMQAGDRLLLKKYKEGPPTTKPVKALN